MLVHYNEHGRRIGQYHHQAKLTDHEIELIHELREEGLSVRKIAIAMECSHAQVWNIISGISRSQPIARTKIITEESAEPRKPFIYTIQLTLF